jgi:hypothetical protein
MSDNKHKARRRRDHAVEASARALGLSKERLIALVEEAVNERQADLLRAYRK